jgi:pimeloyl-ACP methyl ester carboxylesterase
MTRWMTGVCEANSINIRYLRTGGAKPPLVLLHGLTGSGACWTPVARSFEAEYDVVMPDARGHGASSAPPHGYSYRDQARDMVELISKLGLAAPILLGHSMGGMTAAVVAAQSPGIIRGLVLADPTFLEPGRQREVYESDVAEQHRRALSQGQNELLADLRRRHPHRSAEILELLAGARLKTRMNAFEVLTPPNPEYRRLVSIIGVPSLLVTGDAGVVSREMASELQSLNSRLQVEQIQGAGHGLHYDQPERFAAVVQLFLRSLTAASLGV